MNRSRRYQQNKPFVPGGIYNAQQANINQQRPQQYDQPSRQQQNLQNKNANYQQSQQQPQRAQPQRVQQQQLQQQPQQQEQQEQQQSYQGKFKQSDQKKESQYESQNVPEEHEMEEQKYDEDSSMNQDQENDSQDGCNNDDDANSSNNLSLTDKNGKMRFKKIFLVRKKSSVRAREKKIRQNRQLRKAIMPKNALMALNEVKGIQMSDFVLSNNSTGGFTAVVTVNNNQYEGKGNSKASAKNDACEKALRDYVIAKMIRKPRSAKQHSDNTAEPMDADNGNNTDKEQSKDADTNEDQDDVPMINLASFALFKLFSEWENEGFVVPEMHPAAPNGESNGTNTPKEPKKLPIRNELPTGWESMHPATLLCLMRPGIIYTECGTFGEKPNVMQKVTVLVDDQIFYGSGRSKKIARRNAAVSVCNNLFGTNFDDNVEST